MSFAIPSQNLRRKSRWTQSRTRHPPFSLSITTGADLNTDITRVVRSGPAPDVTRASGEDHAGGDVVMREDENDGGHPRSAGPDSRRRITTKREPREVRDERPSTNEQHVPRRILGKTTPREQAVAVTTQEALDGSREKTMRIANVENSALNSVSISSAGALDMTHCDFSVKSARDDETHHLEAVRLRCMAKVMAAPGTRTAVADLCMFGLAACDEGGPRERHPSRQDGRRLTTGNQGSPTCARDKSEKSTRRKRGQSYTRQRRHSRC